MREAEVLWDVVEEHLDEAEYLLEDWEGALVSPSYRLDDIRSGPEARLFAHLDGLVVGGKPVTERLLEPAVAEGPTRERVCAATLALLDAEGGGRADPLLLDHAELPEPSLEGVVLALQLSMRRDLTSRVLLAIDKAPAPALFQILAGRGADPGKRVDAALRAEDPELVAAALAAARHAASTGRVAAVEHQLRSEDPAVITAAIETGLVWGVAGAWGLTEYRAREGEPEALARVAMFGTAAQCEALAGRLDAEDSRADAIWALGLSGRPAAIEACLPLLDDEAAAPLVGEAFAAFTGVDPDDDTYFDDAPYEDPENVALEDDDLDADLVPTPAAELRVPNPDALRAWWTEHSGRLDRAHRYLGGRRMDRQAVVEALRNGPMRRRAALALEVAVRTRGAHQLPSYAFAATQLDSLEKIAAAMGRLDPQTPFARM